MKKIAISLLLSLVATLTFAQLAAPGDSLYKALGGKPGLVKLMDDFMPRLVSDPRTGPFFKAADQRK